MSVGGTLPLGALARLAWRNLWRNRRRTAIMLLEIATGAWAMIFMTALMRGMVDQMVEDGIDALPGQVQVHHADYRDDPSIENRIPEPGPAFTQALVAPPASGWTARVRVPAMISSERDNRGVTLLGVDPAGGVPLPATVIVWSLDPTTARWHEVGEATLDGSVYTATVATLAPELKIIAPVREWQMGRDEEIAYAAHADGLKATLSVAENLAFWAEIFGTRDIAPALRAFDLTDLADRPAQNLSAGQKRRLGLARLVVTNRPVWLLDEPTVSLDAASTERFRDLIADHLSGGGAAVIATHIDLGFEAETLDLGQYRAVPGQGDARDAFDEAFVAELDRLFHLRRDVRRFRSDPVPAALLDALFATLQTAPSVGLSQPWRIVFFESQAARAAARRASDPSPWGRSTMASPKATRSLA